MQKERIIGLDIFRGLALLMMMTYHFTYDLNYFGFIRVDMNHTPSFLLFRYTIISMFLMNVGVSLTLVHQNGIRWLSVCKRILQLGLASLLITSVTYFIFPNSWIYFGILHFIFVTSLLILPLLPFPKLTFILAIFILVTSASKLIDMNGVFALLQTPLHLPYHSEDLIPLVPWIAVVLLGMSLVQQNYHQKIFTSKIFTTHSIFHKILKTMGQHSLLIYLSHQLLFFGAFELYFIVFSK